MESQEFHRTRYAEAFVIDEQRWLRIGPCLRMMQEEQKKQGRRLAVLDAGCGDGTVSRLFVEAGWRVLGVDLVPEFVAKAVEKGIEAKTADVTQDGLPFSDGEIDVIYAGALIEHLYDPEFFLRECRRVLKEAGIVILSVPNIASLTSRLRMLLGRGPKYYTAALGWEFSGHIRAFTSGTLKQLLEESGFAVEEMTANLVSFIPARKTCRPWSVTLGRLLPGLGEVLIVRARKQPRRTRGMSAPEQEVTMERANQRPPYFIDPGQAPKFAQSGGLETTVLTGLRGERMMMALNATLPGHSVLPRSHPHEQVGMVLSGRATLRIGDEEREVGPGDFYRIPGGVPHSDTALGDEPFVMLDIFCPVREDFLARLQGFSAGR